MVWSIYNKTKMYRILHPRYPFAPTFPNLPRAPPPPRFPPRGGVVASACPPPRSPRTFAAIFAVAFTVYLYAVYKDDEADFNAQALKYVNNA